MSSDYISSSDFKAMTWASGTVVSTSTSNDAWIAISVTGASRAVDRYCSRSFGGSTATSTRVFRPTDYGCLNVDDIATTTGLVIASDTAGDGTYGTQWAATDYELEPLNQLLDGQPWAYTSIRAIGGQSFPLYSGLGPAPVQITATWGWPTVPADVLQAVYILALDLFKMKDNPFGVAGTTEFGVMRIRENGQLKMLLHDFRRHGAMV